MVHTHPLLVVFDTFPKSKFLYWVKKSRKTKKICLYLNLKIFLEVFMCSHPRGASKCLHRNHVFVARQGAANY